MDIPTSRSSILKPIAEIQRSGRLTTTCTGAAEAQFLLFLRVPLGGPVMHGVGRMQTNVIQAKKQIKTDRPMHILEVYIAPAFLFGVGLVFIILAFTISFPDPNSLSEVHGHLSAYDFYQTGRGKGDYRTIISLQEGRRFWTYAIVKENAEAILKERGLGVRYYTDPHSTYKPMDGDAIKAYGLWIDGRQIESVEESISRDKAATHIWFPVVGIFAIVVAGFFHRRKKAKYSRHA